MINCSEVIINWFTHEIYSRRKFPIRWNSVESLLHFIGAIGRIVEYSLKSSGVAISCKAAAQSRRRLTNYMANTCAAMMALCLCVRANDTHKGNRRKNIEGALPLFLRFTPSSENGWRNWNGWARSNPIDLNGNKVAIDTARWVGSSRIQAKKYWDHPFVVLKIFIQISIHLLCQ